MSDWNLGAYNQNNPNQNFNYSNSNMGNPQVTNHSSSFQNSKNSSVKPPQNQSLHSNQASTPPNYGSIHVNNPQGSFNPHQSFRPYEGNSQPDKSPHFQPQGQGQAQS